MPEPFLKIFEYIEHEKYKDAFDLLEIYLQEDKQNPFLFYIEAVLNIYMQRYPEAWLSLGELTDLHPNYIPAMHATAFLFLVDQNDVESSLNKWFAILELDPKDKLAKKNISLVKEGKIDKSTQRFQPAHFLVWDKNYLIKKIKATSPQLMKKKKKAKPERVKKGEDTHIPESPPLASATSSRFQALKDKYEQIQRVSSKTQETSSEWNFFNVGILLFSSLILIFLGILFWNPDKESLPTEKANLPSSIEQNLRQYEEWVYRNAYNQATIGYNSWDMDQLLTQNPTWKDSFQVLKNQLRPPLNSEEIDLEIFPVQVLKNPLKYRDTFVSWTGTVQQIFESKQHQELILSIDDKYPVNAYFLGDLTDIKTKDLVSVFSIVRVGDEAPYPVRLEIRSLEKLS